MQTSVNLQELYNFSIIPLVIIIFAIIVETCYFIYLKYKKSRLEIETSEIKVIPEKNIKNISVIKNKYLNELDSIEYKYNNNMIEIRKAYQLISSNIRLFVFEITDIKTQNFSLYEIEKLNIPSLYELVKEYYEPEFASKSVGDFSSSISKARRVIKEWN